MCIVAYDFGYRRPAYTVAHDKLSLASYRQAAQTVPIVSSYIHAGDQLDRVTGSMCICTYIHICTYIIYVFATFSFDTVFRVNASLFSVTSFKGVSSCVVIIALVLPVWGFPIQKICQHLELCVRNCVFQLQQLLTEANPDS